MALSSPAQSRTDPVFSPRSGPLQQGMNDPVHARTPESGEAEPPPTHGSRPTGWYTHDRSGTISRMARQGPSRTALRWSSAAKSPQTIGHLLMREPRKAVSEARKGPMEMSTTFRAIFQMSKFSSQHTLLPSPHPHILQPLQRTLCALISGAICFEDHTK